MIAGVILVFLGVVALFAFRVATDPIYLVLVLGFIILWMAIKRRGTPASASTGSGSGSRRRGAAEAVNTAADAAGAHYLPPPEGIQRIEEIINDIT